MSIHKELCDIPYILSLYIYNLRTKDVIHLYLF